MGIKTTLKARKSPLFDPADSKGLNRRYLLAALLVAMLAAFAAVMGAGGVFRDTQAVMVVGVLLVLAFTLSVGAPVKYERTHLVFVALVAVYLLSALTSAWWAESLLETGLLLGYLAVFFLGTNIIGGDRRRLALHALVLAGASVAALGLYQHLIGYEAQIESLARLGYEAEARQLSVMSARAFGSFPTANAFGGFMVLLIPVAIGLAKYEADIRWRAWSGGTAAVMAAALYFSFSRAAALALLVGLGAAALLWAARSGRRRLVLAVPAGMALGGVVLFGLFFRFRFDRVISRLTGRGELWEAAATMVRDHPLLGVGAAGFGTALPGYQVGTVFSRFAHNSYLQVAAELGFPGLIVFAALIVVLLAGVRRVYLALDEEGSWVVLGLFAGLVAVIAHNIIDYTFYMPAVALVFWWTAGLALGDEKAAPVAGSKAGPARAVGTIAVLLLAVPFTLLIVSQSAASVAKSSYEHHVVELGREIDPDKEPSLVEQDPGSKIVPLDDSDRESGGSAAEHGKIAAAYSRALKFNPADSETYDSYARTLLEESQRGHGDFLVAAARFQKRAIALRPAWPYYHLRLARIEEAAGNGKKARRAFEKASALGPREPKILAEQGYFALRDGRAQDALATFEQAISLENDYGEGRTNEQLQDGRGDGVYPLLEIGHAYNGAALALIELEEYDEAQEALEAAERLLGRTQNVKLTLDRLSERLESP